MFHQSEFTHSSTEIINNERQNMTKLEDNMIVEALETLAAAFPWDEAEIWVARQPSGCCRFTAILQSNPILGLEFASDSEDSPMEAVNALTQKQFGLRDPGVNRENKIRELREQIEKLQAVVTGM